MVDETARLSYNMAKIEQPKKISADRLVFKDDEERKKN